jgi:hypothetical protein
MSEHTASANVIVLALEQTLERLTRAPQTRESKALLLESRRLLRIVSNWGAVPPSTEARREMLARVMSLASSSGAIGIPSPPPPPVSSTSRGAPARGMTPMPMSSPVPPPFRTTPPPPSSQRTVARGVELVEPDQMSWEPLQKNSGVWVKTLRRDHRSGVYTSLLRLEPGAQLARHRHRTTGEMFIVEGAALIGDVEARAGYYCYAIAGAVHEPILSKEGCVMLLVGSESDEEIA